MKGRQVLSALGAAALGACLLWWFVASTAVSIEQLWRRLSNLNAWPLSAVFVGTVISVAAGAEKWRLVEATLSGTTPTRLRAIALSAIGTGLGQVMPAPIASALVRAAGNRLGQGRGARRGAFSSIWEQAFDIGLIGLLVGPALFAAVSKDWGLFLLGAPMIAICADRLVKPVVERLSRSFPASHRLLDPVLCLHLYRLSILRFLALTAISLGVAAAIRSPIQPAALAAALPPVALAATASFIPAGLGVSEWSFALFLRLSGASANDVAIFALMNRLLAGSLSIGLAIMGTLVVRRAMQSDGSLIASAPQP